MNEPSLETFSAPRGIRRSEAVTVIVFTFLIFLILATGLYLLLGMKWQRWAVEQTHSSWTIKPKYLWLVLGVSFLIAVPVGLLWWRCKKFRIALGEGGVQIGEDPGRPIPYDDVEMVSLYRRDMPSHKGSTDSLVLVSARGRNYHVLLDPDDRLEFFRAITAKCPNAIYVDDIGRQLISKEVQDRQAVMRRLHSYNRKSAMRMFTLAAIALALMLLEYLNFRNSHIMNWTRLSVLLVGFVLAILLGTLHLVRTRAPIETVIGNRSVGAKIRES